MKTTATLFIISAVLSSALARTDLSGCTRTTVLLADRSGYTTFYWNPEVREQCSILDCGGGRAPPKSNVPGCPLYTGTDPVAVTGWPAEATPYELDVPQTSEAPAPTPAPEAPAPPSPTPEAPLATTPAPDAAAPSDEGEAPSPNSTSPSVSASRTSGLSTITTSPRPSSSVSRPASASVSGSNANSESSQEPTDAGSATRFVVSGGALAVAFAFFAVA